MLRITEKIPVVQRIRIAVSREVFHEVPTHRTLAV